MSKKFKGFKYDISGWVTKNDVLCSDGRTIKRDAFAKDDGKRVPMFWQHMHNDPTNVLGHMMLENRKEGVYGYAKFNNTVKAQHALDAVLNEDLNSFSIFATNLVHSGDRNVVSGQIKEVSLVLVGANQQAKIDSVQIRHSDGYIEESDQEFIFLLGETLEHSENDKTEKDKSKESEEEEETKESTEDEEEKSEEEKKSEKDELSHSDQTVADIYESMSEEQKQVVGYIVEQIINDESVAEHSGLEGENTTMNIFENQGAVEERQTLSHAQQIEIIESGKRLGKLSDAFNTFVSDQMAHAETNGVAGETFGITNIDWLFPEFKTLTNTPTLYGREMDWVGSVLGGVHNLPFSRIKSMQADITEDEARARGYIKGTLKKEEVFSLMKRTTAPTLIYKKQKLDREDILQIVDFDVVVWLKAEMSLMLREEIARSILISDGRDANSPDKIKDPSGSVDGIGVRSIYHDNELYAIHDIVDKEEEDLELFIERVVLAQDEYRGKGSPTLYAPKATITKLLLLKDKVGRRLYNSLGELATAMGVSNVVKVDLMANQKRTHNGQELQLQAIMVNLADYAVGRDRGMDAKFFDDFDIDYNQEKYLLETMLSGALKDPKTAVVFEYKTETVQG